MAKVTTLTSVADADAMLAASQDQPVYLLKHSIACPVSARGQEQFVGLEAEGDPPLYCVVVQYARDVSTYLAETLDVQHETPQALLIAGGQAVHAASHRRIQTAALREAARAHAADTATP